VTERRLKYSMSKN